MDFVSLHHHSTFSYMDGFGLPKEHVARAEELGMRALALTEHGNTSSHAQLEKATANSPVKPIYGCELYTGPRNMREVQNMRKWHMTALAANAEGYRNLNKIVTRSWSEGFYRWPTVTGDILEDHPEGLILTSGCADGLVACTLLGGKGIDVPKRPNIKRAITIANYFNDLLDGRYYLEVQQFPELERTRTLNPLLAHISEKTGIPLIATADVHYPYPNDNEMQKILHAAGRNTGTVAAAEAEWEYDIRLTLPESDDILLKNLKGTGLTQAQAVAAISNTGVVADMCNVTLPRSEQLRFPLPAGFSSPVDLTWEWLREGWKFRSQRNPDLKRRQKEYLGRMRYEMELIVLKDYCDYFLMLSDAVRFAKDNGIPVGPARGSAAASLVCYLLRITEVDPMQFPMMMFERFIDKDRADLPDVDLDFADDRRDEVRQHLISRYGADHVSNIGNFTRYRGKNAINDVGRVYRIPKYETEKVNDLIIERSGGDSRFDASIEDTVEMFPIAREVFDSYPELNNAVRLEGNYKGMGVHAAGLVVSKAPITDTCAAYTRNNVGADKKTMSVIAYDKKDAEYLGMLKVDMLGLKTMGMIAKALDLVGMSLDDLYQIPLDDPETMAAFERADVVGIFQFEGRATRLLAKQVKATDFMHIADLNALSRPGPLFSGASAQYVEVKSGQRERERLHPIVDKWTERTNGCIIYQEQVLNIIKEMGGFPVTRIADIRKIISQKLGEASFNAMKDEFITGAKRIHDIDGKLADRVWKLMVTSATYSFNVAHCISYGMLGFWAMWLKVHHPVAFYASQLSKIDNTKAQEARRITLIKDAMDHGIDVTAPDLALSEDTWTADIPGNRVVAGFQQIKGIGPKQSTAIIEERAIAPFEDWGDLIRVKGIGPSSIAKIKEFAEGGDAFGINRIKEVLDGIRGELFKQRRSIMQPSHTSDEIPREPGQRVTFLGFVRFKEYKDYIEDQRSSTGESVEDIRARMKAPDLVKSCAILCYDDGHEDVYARFNRFKFPRYKEALERINPGDVIMFRGTKSNGFGTSIQVDGDLLVFKEDTDDEEEESHE